ncbi:MAG: DUF4395 domain-containing protein [Ferruginibacter sp.]
MQKTIECPVDFVTVNETQVRTTAFLVLLTAIGWFISGNLLVIAFLVPDFFMRAFNFGKYSPLNLASRFFVHQLSLPVKPIDQAPKRFAAKIGLIFTAAITILQLLQYKTAAGAAASVLIFFALLESAFGFCAGCHAYTFYRKLFVRK